MSGTGGTRDGTRDPALTAVPRRTPDWDPGPPRGWRMGSPLERPGSDQAPRVLDGDVGLRALLTATRSVVEELSVPAVLRSLVTAATTITGARHAAVVVLGPDGVLEDLVHTGMSDDEVALLRALPEGRTSRAPSRGVPVRSGGALLGMLHLIDRADGRRSSAEDDELLAALVATAGTAIENARLYDDARRQQEWLAAAAEISRRLLSPSGDTTVVLQLVADTVARLARADVVAVVLPTDDDPDSLEIRVVSGQGAEVLRLQRYLRTGTLDEAAMEAGEGVLLDAVQDQDQDLRVHLTEAMSVGPVMALPLVSDWGPRGAIVVGRIAARPRFTRAELDLAGGFAAQAALALELADARADQQRLTVVEDRNRIARDLHDHVVQRLYASGLGLQGALTTQADGPLKGLLERTVAELGETIRQVRTSIFALTDTDLVGPRAAVLDVLRRTGAGLRTSPRVTFTGPVDTAVDEEMVSDLTAVVGEAVTNVVRHAEADMVEVGVHVHGGWLRVAVSDDGVGLADARRGHGLENLARRADRAGGRLTLGVADAGGLLLRWEVPLLPGS